VKLERAILKMLAASRRALTATIIADQIRERLQIETTATDVTLALRRMETEGDVKGTHNADFGTMWKETDEGRLRIS